MGEVREVNEMNEAPTILLLRLRDWQSSSSNSSKSTQQNHILPHTLRPCKPTHKSATLRLCTAHCTNCFLLLHGAAVVLKRGPPSALSNCSLAPMRLCCPHPADCILLPTRKTTNSLFFTELMVKAHYLFQRARQTSSGDRAVPVMRGGATFELQICTCGTKWREERLRTDGQMCTQFVWTTLLRLVKNL